MKGKHLALNIIIEFTILTNLIYDIIFKIYVDELRIKKGYFVVETPSSNILLIKLQQIFNRIFVLYI